MKTLLKEFRSKATSVGSLGFYSWDPEGGGFRDKNIPNNIMESLIYLLYTEDEDIQKVGRSDSLKGLEGRFSGYGWRSKARTADDKTHRLFHKVMGDELRGKEIFYMAFGLTHMTNQSVECPILNMQFKLQPSPSDYETEMCIKAHKEGNSMLLTGSTTKKE